MQNIKTLGKFVYQEKVGRLWQEKVGRLFNESALFFCFFLF